MELSEALARVPAGEATSRETITPDELAALRRAVRGGGHAAAYARERLQLAGAAVPETLGIPYRPLPGKSPEVLGHTS